MNFPDLPLWINRETIAMAGLLVIITAICIMWWVEAKRNPLVQCFDAVTADNGRLSSTKLFQAGAFIFTLWGMYWLIVTGRAGAIELAAWGGMWIAGYAVNKKQNNDAVVEVAKVAGDSPPPLPKVSDKS
jgi:hypothetical protein